MLLVVLGAGVGALVRNTRGAVTGAVLLLLVASSLAVQLASEAAAWTPNTLASFLSGVSNEVALPAALAAWAVIPAALGSIAVQRRDVVCDITNPRRRMKAGNENVDDTYDRKE